MGSITVLALAASMMSTQAPTMEPRLMRQPDIFGNTIAFCYAGDIWIASTEPGSVARRLTSTPANEVRPQFSPDGKTIAFTGGIDGGSNIYTIPVEGGEPKRLTYGSVGDNCMDWTPDGRIAYVTAEGNPYNGRQAQLMIVSPKGGVPQLTPIKEISTGSFFAGGKKIAYNRVNSFNYNWRRYRGGTQGRISIYDMEKNEYSELPSKREQSYHPLVLGDDIYYISDRANGTLNLYKNSNGKDTQLTKDADSDIRWPQTDGKTIVYERDGYLFHYNPATNKEVKLSPRILSENIASRPVLKNLTPYISSMSLSPSGNRIAVEARGEIFSLPAKTGETRNLTMTSGVREQRPQWSPDGKQIVFLSDATGEHELYIRPQGEGEATQLTNKLGFRIEYGAWTPDSKSLIIMAQNGSMHLMDVATKKLTTIDAFPYGGGTFDVSKDSKWIAYNKAGTNFRSAIYLYEIATGKATKVTEGMFNDSDLCFDQNGKYLYFSSDRTFNPTFGSFEFSLKVENVTRLYAIPLAAGTPNPFLDNNDEEPAGEAPKKKDEAAEDVKIDFDGIESRTMVLPHPAGSYGGLTGVSGGFVYQSEGTLFQYNIGSKTPTPLYEGVGGVTFNASHTKMAVLGRGGLQILPVAPGGTPAVGRVDTSNVEAVIDPKAEWKQIFWDAWRYERDYFYDPTFGGQDWMAVGKKYEGYLQYVNHRGDLNYILGLMIGELGTGHAYIQGLGDLGNMGTRVPVGNLCADYEVANGGVRFAKILRGFNDVEQYQTPLGLPGMDVKEGEYLVAIDGKPVTENTNPAEFLVGKVGKTVTLSINSRPGLTGARKVRVKPIGTDIQARYFEFVENNRKLVSKLSGGKIGYMHISNTAAEGSTDFVRGFYSQSDKEAMVVDERWNGGGYIQPWFVDTLSRKKKAMIQPRVGADAPDSETIEGPMALLINQYAGSGGDFFPYMFKQAKRGPLIGKRTWGGLVGINGGYQLVDGGNLTAPAFSIYNPDTEEIIAENTGVDPDIDVDMRPDLVAKGQDPQLEVAVKHLMDQLAKMPAKKVRNGIPKVSKPGKINP